MKELKILKKDIIKWIVVISVLLVIPYSSVLVVLVFTYLFFKKKIYNIDLLILYFLLFFIQNISGGSSDSSFNNIRFLLIFVSFAKTVGQNGFSYKLILRRAFYFPLLFIFLVLHSILFSYEMNNSLVEIASFMLLFFFAFKNTYFENIQHRTRIINDIEAMYISVIFLSIISFAVPAVSYARNGTGFQGVGNHPNSFGVVLAPYCGWILIRLLKKFTLKDFIFTIVSFLLLYISQSRTSMLSVFLGIIFIMLINRKLRIMISRKVFVLLFSSAALIIINFNTISNSIFDFMDKSKTGSIEESVLMSRGSLIENQTNNINKNPLFGIGFKTPTDLILKKSAFSLGKPYEKGNMLTAAVEELGIVGFIVLFITIISLLKLGMNKRNVLLVLPLIALSTTIGEATLFSIGGIGVLIWMYVFLTFHSGIVNEKINRISMTKNQNLIK